MTTSTDRLAYSPFYCGSAPPVAKASARSIAAEPKKARERDGMSGMIHGRWRSYSVSLRKSLAGRNIPVSRLLTPSAATTQRVLWLGCSDLIALGVNRSDLYMEALQQGFALHAAEQFVQPLKPYLRWPGADHDSGHALAQGYDSISLGRVPNPFHHGAGSAGA